MFLPSCIWHYPSSHCLTCVWHQNSSCNTMCCFPSVEVEILAAPCAKGWGVVDIPHGWGSESLICATMVIAKAEIMQIYFAPSLMSSRELWVPPTLDCRGWIKACQNAPEQLSHSWFLPANVQKLDCISTYQELFSAHFPQKPAAGWAEHSEKANLSMAIPQKASWEGSV